MLTRLLRTHLEPYRRLLAGVVALQLLATIASLLLPSLNADLIDRGVAVGDTGAILRIGRWMLLVALVQGAASYGAVVLGSRTAAGFGRDVRGALFHRVGTFSAREIGQLGAPSLITRTTNDVTQVQLLVQLSCSLLVAAPITCVGGVVMALREDLGLSWLMGVSVPVLAVSIGLVARRMVPGFRSMQVRIDAVNRVLREQITGVRVVRAFVREPFERQRFARVNGELTETATAVGRLTALMFPIVMLVLNVSSVAVLWFGGHRIADGQMQVGALTAFLSYLLQILMSVMMATFVLVMVPRAAVCAERIEEVLGTASSVVPPAVPVRPPGRGADLVLDHVGFTYPGADAPVLRDVTLTARAGQTTAVVGSTGSGKTTLVQLVPRLMDATTGAVRLDDVDVRGLAPDDLWDRIGLVPQQPYLFGGTVASNLRLGAPDATDDELWAALDVAQARDFVEAMAQGLLSPVAQGGTNLSGGQRQRLAIARAVVRRPAVYLFDDAFSALDLRTDARVRAALRPVVADSVVLVVAQRVSTVVDADQIVVLEGGAVVGLGRHDDLLATCPTYREIVASQLTAEEAA
ncbi:ABC transporter ATP-binding protein [Angustibacter aerolatus]